MDCKQYSENLTAFLDGELSPSDTKEIQSHLLACASCSEELRSLRSAADFIESHHRNLIPQPGSWNLVRARITETNAAREPHISIFHRFRWAMVMMALVAIFAFGYTQYQQTQRRSLDRYISQYMLQRESQIDRQSPAVDPYEGNPFMEAKATVIGNPFLSEER